MVKVCVSEEEEGVEHHFSGFVCGETTVEYEVGEWAEGPGPLFVFDSLESALKFVPIKHGSAFSLRWSYWEVETEELREGELMLGIWAADCMRNVVGFWDLESRGELDSETDTDVPEGTWLADRVKLVREIDITKEAEDEHTPQAITQEEPPQS